MPEKDLYDLTVEISSISAIIIGLSNQLEEDCDRLTPQALRLALNGVSNYLDRIAADMQYIDEKGDNHEKN